MSLMMFMMFYTTLLLALHCVPTNVLTKVTGSLPLVATKKKHGMRNLSNECLVTAPEEAIKRAARVEAALEAALEKAPQTRNFLEEELPRVSISCQAGFEPGRVMTSRGRPHKGLADGYLLPEPRGQPQQMGLAEVLPGRVRNLPGP